MSSVAPAAGVERPPERPARWLLVPLLGGTLVALALGLLARAEAISPGSYPGGYFRLFFSDPIHLKAWCATAAVALAVLQLGSAAWLYGRIPWTRPRHLGAVHRWSGRLALALTLPVVYHCVFKLGFQNADTRVYAHSFLGCAVYGAFAAKILVVRLHRFPGWALPLAGGVVFATLVAVWYTSAVWFLDQFGWSL